MNSETIVILVIGIVVISIYALSTGAITETSKSCKSCELITERLERCEMYNPNISDMLQSNVNGVYFPGKYYAVNWVSDRDPTGIKNTEWHEYCHRLIMESDEGYNHFCVEFGGNHNGSGN